MAMQIKPLRPNPIGARRPLTGARLVGSALLLTLLAACVGPDLVDPARDDITHPANPDAEAAPVAAMSDALSSGPGEHDRPDTTEGGQEKKKHEASEGHDAHRHHQHGGGE